jgi:hypothetical protein
MCLKTFVSKPYPLQNLLKQRMKTYKIVVILHLNGKKTSSKASDGKKMWTLPSKNMWQF